MKRVKKVACAGQIYSLEKFSKIQENEIQNGFKGRFRLQSYFKSIFKERVVALIVLECDLKVEIDLCLFDSMDLKEFSRGFSKQVFERNEFQK